MLTIQKLPAVCVAAACVVLVSCKQQIPASTDDLTPDCYAVVTADSLTTTTVELILLEFLDAGEIQRAKVTLINALLVDATTLPAMLKRAGNPEQLSTEAEEFATRLLTHLDELFRNDPDEALSRGPTARNGLAGLKMLLKQEHDQKRLSELMIQLYGTDKIDLPFHWE